jgi:membrane-associated phospholipid phosphatase
MFSSLESGIGLEVVVWLQANGNPFLDSLARVFHYLGLPVFYVPLLTVVYWSLDKQLGRRLLFALVLSLAVVSALKFVFGAPRPYQAFPDQVTALVVQGGYGIPSGHVSDGLVMWGYLIYRIQRRWLWGLLAVYVGIMMWARMYAGVHYPQDVIAGLLVGIAVLWVFVRIADPLEVAWQELNIQSQIGVVLLSVALMVGFLFGSEDGMSAAGALLGGGLGYILETHFINFTAMGSTAQRILRYVIGIALALALFFGLDVLFERQEPVDILRILRYAAVTLFAVAGWPWLMGRLGLSADALSSSPSSPVPASGEGE